jgi:hypothetical protein
MLKCNGDEIAHAFYGFDKFFREPAEVPISSEIRLAAKVLN